MGRVRSSGTGGGLGGLGAAAARGRVRALAGFFFGGGGAGGAGAERRERSGAGVFDGGYYFADFYFLALGGFDAEDAGFLGGDLGGDLVGLEGEEEVAGLDGLAFLFVPGGDECRW